jgi:hypothetical protein
VELDPELDPELELSSSKDSSILWRGFMAAPGKPPDPDNSFTCPKALIYSVDFTVSVGRILFE